MIDTKPAPLLASEFAPTSIPVAPRTALMFNLLALAVAATAALLPLLVMLYWALIDLQTIQAATGLLPEVLGAVSAQTRLLCGLITVIGLAPLSWGLLRLRVCFSEFAHGRPFSARGIAGLRDFAAGIGFGVISKAISFTALTLVLSWNAPPGMRQLSAQINSDMGLMLLFAAIIAALAWAMEKAAAIAEENSQFV
jgi:hypothetical protein